MTDDLLWMKNTTETHEPISSPHAMAFFNKTHIAHGFYLILSFSIRLIVNRILYFFNYIIKLKK